MYIFMVVLQVGLGRLAPQPLSLWAACHALLSLTQPVVSKRWRIIMSAGPNQEKLPTDPIFSPSTTGHGVKSDYFPALNCHFYSFLFN